MAAPTEKDIEEVVVMRDRLERDIAFEESVQMEAVQIEGTRYKYVINE